MDHYSEVYTQLQTLLGRDEQLSTANVISVAVTLMQFVEKFTDMTGQDKKQLILDVLNRHIREQVSNDALEDVILTVVNYVLPTTIDHIVAFNKGALTLSEHVRKNCKFLSCKKS